MKRIGIDARLLGYRMGGISEYTRQLIDALAVLDTETAFTILHRYSDNKTYTPSKNFRRANLYTPAHHRFERVALSVELAPYRLGLLHSPDFIPPYRGAQKHVITIHDLHFLRYPEFQTSDSLRYYAQQIHAAVAHADHIFAQTEGTRQEIVGRLNVPSDKVTVHLLGVNPAFQVLDTATVAACRERYRIPKNYLLFVGTIEPRKNLPGLIEAYQQLKARYQDMPPLVIVGHTGWNAEPSLQAMKTAGNSVIWLQGVPFEDLPALYNGAMLLVLPSFHEGFGMPAVEAMACGTPVVVARRGSLPEVVGEAGVYIDPEDATAIAHAIATLLDDSQRAADFIQKGLKRANQFTWAHTAQIALNVYRNVLES